MKKIVISKLFLYRHRFVIGYVVLGLAFVGLLIGLPLISQNGLTAAEMESASNSFALSVDAPLHGDLVDLPYRVLQKLSIMVFGLTPYAIKLPSIIFGILLGVLLILLLNRWFKNNVSLLASALVVLSTPFLFLAGNGTPLIMVVFWPTLLLWLGSKIQGEKRPKPIYSFLFAASLLLAVFTPYMGYFALFCVIFVLVQPHLRFVVKSLPKIPLTFTLLFAIAGLVALGLNMVNHPDTIMELLFAKDYDFGSFFPNIASGLSPVLSWRDTPTSVFLSPLLGLPMLALAAIGLLSTTKGFFASRNSIASVLLVFTFIITGFNPLAVVFFILPFAILTAHGIKYLLEKWYGLFPENPYARVAGVLPLILLFGVIIVPSLIQYVYGYRYNPTVVSQFSYDLPKVSANATEGALVVGEEYDFYKIMNGRNGLQVVREIGDISGEPAMVSILHEKASPGAKYQLSRIITSHLKEKSDIIYIYTVKGE